MKLLMIAIASAGILGGNAHVSAQERHEYSQERQERRVVEQELRDERRDEQRAVGREGFDPAAEIGGAPIHVPGEGNPYAAQGGSVPGEVNPDRVPPNTPGGRRVTTNSVMFSC